MENTETLGKDERELLDTYRQFDPQDQHRLMLAVRAIRATAEDRRRRGF